MHGSRPTEVLARGNCSSSLLIRRWAIVCLAWFAISATGLRWESAHADPFFYVDAYGSITSTVSEAGDTAQSLSVGSALPNPGTNANVFAQVVAGPNLLGVYGVAEASGTTSPQYANPELILTDAEFADPLLLSDAPQSGILAVNVDVHGSNIVIADGGASPFTDIRLLGFTVNSALPGGGTATEDDAVIDGNNVLDIPYVLEDDVATFGIRFESQDSCEAWIDPVTQLPGSCFAASEFLDTAQVSSITVEAANGVPVPGASVFSLSGISYTLPAVASVPEPSIPALLGASLVGFFLFKRKRPKATYGHTS